MINYLYKSAANFSETCSIVWSHCYFNSILRKYADWCSFISIFINLNVLV